jgi:hypothetical protein
MSDIDWKARAEAAEAQVAALAVVRDALSDLYRKIEESDKWYEDGGLAIDLESDEGVAALKALNGTAEAAEAYEQRIRADERRKVLEVMLRLLEAPTVVDEDKGKVIILTRWAKEWLAKLAALDAEAAKKTQKPSEAEGGVMTGAELIIAERWRQIEKEGWTHDHDDQHLYGELAAAAISYIAHAAQLPIKAKVTVESEFGWIRKWLHPWPWEARWWKPDPDPVRNLVKAGALIAAEIDRLNRSKAPATGRPSTGEGGE